MNFLRKSLMAGLLFSVSSLAASQAFAAHARGDSDLFLAQLNRKLKDQTTGIYDQPPTFFYVKAPNLPAKQVGRGSNCASIRIYFLETGNVDHIDVVNSRSRETEQAMVKAAKHWMINPPTIRGQKQKIDFQYGMCFVPDNFIGEP